MPRNGKPYALNLHNGVIYTASAQGCGGVTNSFYSFDLATQRASAFLPAGGGLWGRRGASVAPDGTRVPGHRRRPVQSDDAEPRQRDRRGEARRQQATAARRLLRRAERQLALAPRPRRERDADGVRLSRPQVPRRHEQRMPHVAARSRRARRRRSPHVAPHRRRCSATTRRRSTARASGARWPPGRIRAGAQWVLVPFWGPVSKEFKAPIEHSRPTRGGVGAYKLEQRAGKWQLTPAWLSRDMNLAEEVVIANGVVFAYDARRRRARRRCRTSPGTSPAARATAAASTASRCGAFRTRPTPRSTRSTG